MANNLVSVNMASVTALPEDVVVNAWSFTTATAKDGTQAGAVESALDTFYETVGPFMSNQITGAARIKWYDRADAKPRVPWRDTAITFPVAASSLPLEVALVLSFQAAPVSGSPAARRRGRLYIGPLGQNALSNTTGRPTTGLIDAMATAAAALRLASDATADWSWAVWSGVDSAAREVFRGWVDNDFDTQRRRGQQATARTAWGGV